MRILGISLLVLLIGLVQEIRADIEPNQADDFQSAYTLNIENEIRRQEANAVEAREALLGRRRIKCDPKVKVKMIAKAQLKQTLK